MKLTEKQEKVNTKRNKVFKILEGKGQIRRQRRSIILTHKICH